MNSLNKYFITTLLGSILLSNNLLAQDSAKKPPMSPKVDVYVVNEAKNMPIDLEYPARISSVKNVTVTARVSGVLEKKYFTEGSLVKKGDLLYKIEPNTYQASVNSAKANVDLANSQFEKAKKDWERADSLYQDKAISEQDKDTAYFAYQTAQASVNVAKAQLQKVAIDLQYTNVKATIDGMAGMKKVDVGDYVNAGTALLNITQTNPIYAEFSIPNINNIKNKYQLQNGTWADIQNAKLQAQLIIDGKPYETIGQVDFVDNQVNSQTSTLKARAIFENPTLNLIAGQFAKIKLSGIIFKNGIEVPQKAVLQNPLGTIVFVINDNKVGVRPVQILDTNGQNFIVSGLKAKDVVVVNNFFRVKPGASVIIDKTINK